MNGSYEHALSAYSNRIACAAAGIAMCADFIVIIPGEIDTDIGIGYLRKWNDKKKRILAK